MKLKRLGRIFACMAVLMAMLLAAGCQKSGNSSEESANAVLNQFLSGTVQVADEFDSQYAEIASAETGDETGMVSIDGMEDYFQKQFGEIMTADCIADLMADRSMIAPMKLAQQLDKDIIAQDIQLTAKSGEDNAYDFTAQLVTSEAGWNRNRIRENAVRQLHLESLCSDHKNNNKLKLRINQKQHSLVKTN